MSLCFPNDAIQYYVSILHRCGALSNIEYFVEFLSELLED